MQRRKFLGHAASGIAGATLAACGGSNANEDSRPTFVLVHGAWHGAWCWSEVARLLGDSGYPSIALDLPGHGLGARFPSAYLTQDTPALATEISPLANLTTVDYRNSVVNVVRGLVAGGSGPVILVGHSLGGATVTAVAEVEPTLVRRLVYLTAFVPVNLPTPLDYLQLPSMSSSQVPSLFVGDPSVTACARINFNASDPAIRAAQKSAFYDDLADDAFSAVSNLLAPDEPIGGLTTPATPTTGRWGTVPRTFVRCTLDRAIPLNGQDEMISEADSFTPQNKFAQETLNTSHSPFLSAPGDVAKLLMKAALL